MKSLLGRRLLSVMIILALGIGLIVTGCSGQTAGEGQKKTEEIAKGEASETKVQESADPLQALYEKAKQEGQVNFWAPVDPPQVVQIANAFTKEYPGVKVEPFEIQPEAAIERVIMESKGGKATADIVSGRLSDPGLKALSDRDLLAKHDDWANLFGFPSDFVKEDGSYVLLYTLLSPVTFNTDLISKEEAPKKWEDLLDPKWKGKIILETRGKALAVLAVPWGVEKTVDFARQLAKQEPFFHKGGSTVASQLASGEAPIAVGNYAFHLAFNNNKAGKKLLDWAPVSPIGVDVFATYTLKDSPHPNAAKLLMGWLATDRGQKAFIEATGYGIGLKGAGNSLEVAKEMTKAGIDEILIDAETEALYSEAQKQIQEIFAGGR